MFIQLFDDGNLKKFDFGGTIDNRSQSVKHECHQKNGMERDFDEVGFWYLATVPGMAKLGKSGQSVSNLI